ncbi:MAG: DUF4097 family beta strand repeat-containing protein [Gemmatales bacterium]
MWRLTPLLLLPILLGCTPNYTIVEHTDVSLPFGTQHTVQVEMANGPITITTAKVKEVTGKVTKRGVGADKEEAEKELEAIDFDYKANDDGKMVIKVIRKDGNKHWNSSGAEAHLQIPSHCKLILITSNARIQVTGKNLGTVAKTSNGSVTVKEVQAEVDVNTSNGAVSCSEVVGAAHIITTNATVKVAGKQLLLDCKSSNGSISCRGDLQTGQHLVQTTNAHVTVTLPKDIALQVEATTSNGKINNDFGMNKKDKVTKNSLKGLIGAGDVSKTLVLKTSNSSISLKRDKEVSSSSTVAVDVE